MTFGFSGLPAPLDGKWQHKQSQSVRGRDVPVTVVLDLKTAENGSVNGELIATVNVSEAFPEQNDKVRRLRVEGQFNPPEVVLKVYNEGGELVVEHDGRISEDGKTLLLKKGGGDESARFAKVE